MPPQRNRNGFDDSRSEASSTRDKQPAYTGISKGRRNGTSTLAGSNLKDVTNAQTPTSGQQGDAVVSIDWQTFDTSVLHAYRHVHRLNTPPAFISSYNQRMLTRPGIGQHSPTMARHRARRRTGKAVLALAVRKDFNAAIVLESELISSFLYVVQNQGNITSAYWNSCPKLLTVSADKNFRMRFEPSQAK
ncbi:hypothetical protein HO173_007097 [Letharia columbiana]|uniref:Uncharacterized protein n=1 Tax=Letharia columbiana TaxID=112416 RepID=A0A8H6FTG4_9LECA|nr:uncharacterized protein HO173_007097 [Letharia columbiana]KAF6234472.1 hypothetical protein HO173_007097 [Letharia columbiana]